MKRMRKSIIWMAAFMFCCGAVFAQKAERKNVREGNKLYETEKFTEAEIAYRKSLEVNPRSSEGTYNLGNALYKQKKFPEAAEQYQLLAGQGEKMMKRPKVKLAWLRFTIMSEILACRVKSMPKVSKLINNLCA